MPRNAHFIKYTFRPAGAYTKLTRFVARGLRASQCSLYQKNNNHVNLVLVPYED